jgi:hypothetical protein
MIRPWLPLHTRDVLDCKELARCEPHHRFVLLALMCLAHEGTPYGYLADEVGPLTDQYMASRCLVSLQLFRQAVASLELNTRIKRTAEGVLYISRMVRDEEIRLKRASGGKDSCNNPNVPRRKDGEEGYPSDGPSARKEGYPPPRARAGVRSDSLSDSDSSESSRKGVQGETKPPDDFSQPGPDEYAHRLVYGDPGVGNGLAEQHWTLSDPRLCVVAARDVFVGAADPPGVLTATREQHAKYREYHSAHPKIRGKALQYWIADGQYLVAPPNGDGTRKSRFD